MHVFAGWALCGHETPNLQEESWPESGDGRKQGGLDAEQAKVAAYPPADQQVITLSRSERICLGLKCKRLIDYGRKQWMVEQGFQVIPEHYWMPGIHASMHALQCLALVVSCCMICVTSGVCTSCSCPYR